MTTLATSMLRTPDSAFENLLVYGFVFHFIEDLPGSEGLRALPRRGIPDGHVHLLCLHGQATWNYLHRRMIPVAAVIPFAGHEP